MCHTGSVALSSSLSLVGSSVSPCPHAEMSSLCLSDLSVASSFLCSATKGFLRKRPLQIQGCFGSNYSWCPLYLWLCYIHVSSSSAQVAVPVTYFVHSHFWYLWSLCFSVALWFAFFCVVRARRACSGLPLFLLARFWYLPLFFLSGFWLHSKVRPHSCTLLSSRCLSAMLYHVCFAPLLA